MTDPAEPKIIPFGKYKGRLLEEVLADDPGYLQWLAGQDWFRAKFTVLHQIIINRGAEPEETPEHNAMQVKFLDDEFCFRFLRRLFPDSLEDSLAAASKWLEDTRHNELSNDEEALVCGYRRGGYYFDRAETERQVAVLSDPGEIETVVDRKFEAHGVDVVLALRVRYMRAHDLDKPVNLFVRGDRNCTKVSIELKPAIGDDYPAVLRQMKRNESNVLFVGNYTGQGATEEQFIKTFATANKRVVFLRDVERNG